MMVDISPNAVDQASNRVMRLWHAERNFAPIGSEPEGLHSWLCRMARYALAEGEKLESGKIRYHGMKFLLTPMSVQIGDQHAPGWLLQSVERIR